MWRCLPRFAHFTGPLGAVRRTGRDNDLVEVDIWRSLVLSTLFPWKSFGRRLDDQVNFFTLQAAQLVSH